MSSATYYAGGTVTYYTAAGQPAFNTVATVAAPVWEKVLPVPNQRTVFRQRFMQTANAYSPLAYDTPYPADATYGVPTSTTYYLVSEENFADERGGMLSWDRVYAAVPTAWTEPEEYAYTFPAFSGLQSIGTSYYNVTAITASGSYYALTSSVSFAVGTTLYMNVGFTRYPYTNVKQSQFVVVLASTTTNPILIGNVFDGSGAFTSVTGTIVLGSPGRNAAKTMVVGSNVVNEYALSSVTALDSTLPIIDPFVVLTADGSEIDVITTTTIPSTSTYISMINSETQIVAAASVRRRFLGNIYVRLTRYVTAR